MSTPALWRGVTAAPTYWWELDANFGDQLTPFLFPRYGIAPVHRRPRHAALVGVGSIVEHLPHDYAGTILGSGVMFDRAVDLPNATVAACRGPLSRERLGARGEVALGDPGLLLARWVRRRPTTRRLGLVPHFRHTRDPLWDRLGAAPGTGRIDVRAHPAKVAARISACAAIVTSSLHGLITADAFGIPAVWVILKPELEGGDFKFRDHEAAVGGGHRRVEADDLVRVEDVERLAAQSDAGLVADSVRGLEATISATAGKLSDYAGTPLTALRTQRREDHFGSEGNQWPSAGDD
jgi:pyruvyltransferase